MATVLDIHPADRLQLVKHWWQWVLIILIGLSSMLGSGFLLYMVYYKISATFAKRSSRHLELQKSTKVQIEASTAQLLQRGFEINEPIRSNNFGVYLGSFDSPLTFDQSRILSRWDLVILDPFQNGVVEAVISAEQPRTARAIARIDIGTMGATNALPDDLAIHLIQKLWGTLQLSETSPNNRARFAGVLLSNWDSHFSRPILHYVAKVITRFGLEVYVEVSAPSFLIDRKVLESDAITGLVIRNATVLPNGEQRDVFEMEDMKTATQAFVSQSCLRKFTVLVWDVVEEGVEPSNAVIKRGFQWTRFNNALLWIGPDNVLRDAASNDAKQEPLGAFEWLKESRVLSFHQIWRSNSEIKNAPASNYSAWLELEDIFPAIGLLQFSRENDRTDRRSTMYPSTLAQSAADPNLSSGHAQTKPPWTYLVKTPAGHPLSMSPSGESYNYLGCFPLGINVSKEAFIKVTSSQQRLRRKSLLNPLPVSKMHEIGQVLQDFAGTRQTYNSIAVQWLHSVRELARHLTSSSESDSSINAIKVHIGLDSGFHAPAPSVGMFWGVYAQNYDSGVDIFISRNVQQDLTTVILHTFLSSQGFSRHDCLQAEASFARWSESLDKKHRLPQRFVRDIEMLSPTEIIQFRQILKPYEESNSSPLVGLISAACESHLLDGSDFVKRRDATTVGYLSGRIHSDELISSRVEWYRSSDSLYVTVSEALAIFKQVHQNLRHIVSSRKHEDLSRITNALEKILQPGTIDALSDMLALSIFSFMRKEALDEVFLEVCDRNPLFNDQSDQAAAFAELFAVGSRCESYFDITPSTLGTLISDRYRQHYLSSGHAEPPLWLESSSHLQSAYSAAQIDINAEAEKSQMSTIQHFSFLSVFAIPALIDVLLLTTIGRGLYLSSFMSVVEKNNATLALMISLLLSGAISSWITCGGSYYLISMAFSAMNMFVATRLVAGFAFTVGVGLIGFGIIGVSESAKGGFVFFLYLLALTTYLTLLATLANYQYPGSAFQSGRPIIIGLIPVLFLSPIITIWVQGHDLLIYLSVFYIFIVLLLLGVKRSARKWSMWFIDIETVTDAQVRAWYFETRSDEKKKTLLALTYPKVLKLSREALLREILRVLKHWPFGHKTNDSFVSKLAKSHRANVFLLEWYCIYTGTQAPIPYSSTWNSQTKIALKSLEQLQTGIRLHNAFIHWRKAGDEIGCSMLYYIVALLDKWIGLICGGQVIGFLNGGPEFKMPVGFSLAYYLIGAIFLDFNASAIHKLVGEEQSTAIETLTELPKAVKDATRSRRRMYWKMLGRYTLFHVWSLAIASCLLWIFVSADYNTTVLFICYVVAYTGLLWFQYTKIFSGPKTLKPLLLAIFTALPLGLMLRNFAPSFAYGDVVALATATWTAAILSLHSSGILSKRPKEPFQAPEGIYRSYGTGPDQAWSQHELQSFYRKMDIKNDELTYQISPNSHFGSEIKSFFWPILSRIRDLGSPESLLDAFPEAFQVVENALLSFESGEVTLECVPTTSLAAGPSIQAVSRFNSGRLRILIFYKARDLLPSEYGTSSFCKMAAEILLHSVAENFMRYSHADAFLLVFLLLGSSASSAQTYVPETIQYQLRLQESPSDLSTTLVGHFQHQHLQYLSLGLDCDIEWDHLPRDIRELFLKRFLGESCEFSTNQSDWLSLKTSHNTAELKTYIARCDYGAAAMLACKNYAHEFQENPLSDSDSDRSSFTSVDVLSLRIPKSPHTWLDRLMRFALPLSAVYHSMGTSFKFFMAAVVADSDLQRELDYVLGDKPAYLRHILRVLTTGVWIYAKLAQDLLLPVFLLHGRCNIQAILKNIEGTTVSIKRHFISIESAAGSVTGFIRFGKDGAFELRQYAGKHKREPANLKDLRSVNTYSKDMCLQRRVDYLGGKLVKNYVYEYLDVSFVRRKRLSKLYRSRYPMLRKCTEGDADKQTVYFDHLGYVKSGSYVRHGNFVQFRCHYSSNGPSADNLLRAEFVLPHLTCTVSWAAQSLRNSERLETWVPHSQVTEATFVLGADVYESKWRYDHKFHPSITTTLNGMVVETPPLILYDHLGVLKKPTRFNFLDDDPLATFKSVNPTLASRWGFNKKHRHVSTSEARSRLWKAWRDTPGLDGVTARWLDERLLRKDPFIKPYWRNRDRGCLEAATDFLELNADTVMTSVDLDSSISGFAPLAMKIGDLFSFGQGGDANNRTRSQRNPDFDELDLQVLAADTGTWPNEGGGVSACRRDMINNLKNVKWHMIAESANDFGIPKHQTEQNVQSLKLIPLWGLDFLTPTHGLFQNRLDSQVAPTMESMTDIETIFVPILAALVKGARTVNFSKADLKQTTRAFVDLNAYFEGSKHWGATWTNKSVKAAWRSLWISQDLVVPCHSSTWFKAEIPSIAHLDLALEIWYRYLFIFSIPIPERIPPIFQTSHHSISSAYGMVCKIKRGCTLQIWDHAISWRETNLYLSSALCTLPPFVRNSLLGLMKVTSLLVLHHADTILPCADIFNPGWEVEIGTCKGEIESRKTFRRKVDPIVNGITDWNKFTPVKEIKTSRPTVTMLSHVWYAKDIKTAILSADIIINEWGFRDYVLDIYGALDKAPAYSTDCQELIASKSLHNNVHLRGEANPIKVLENTWLFLNSSVSEGLPLALGEAALTGAPVVCTDVGASLRILTDPDDGSCYSSIVAPNDARAMARAQIKMLAMIGEWSQYAGDFDGVPTPQLSDNPTPNEVALITQRMYEKKEQRRALGMRSREIIQKSFAGDRYLREHEQMLWVGKSRRDMIRIAPRQQPPPREPSRISASTPSPIINTVNRQPVIIRFPMFTTPSIAPSSELSLNQPQSLFTGISDVTTKPSTIYYPGIAEIAPLRKLQPVLINTVHRTQNKSVSIQPVLINTPHRIPRKAVAPKYVAPIRTLAETEYFSSLSNNGISAVV